MTPPLKPCPFCGSAPKSYDRVLGSEWAICCSDTGCIDLRPMVIASDAIRAAEQWNRRAPSIEEGAARRHQEGRTT